MGASGSWPGILAATLAASLLLSGCGGGDDSVADPPISTPTSSSGTPQRESAEHFIRRFADVERAMEDTGKVAEYLKLTAACRPCMDLAGQVRAYYRAGGYVHWAGWSIKSIRPYEQGSRPGSFAVRVVSAPTTYRESSDGPTKRLEGGPATEIVAIKRLNGSWVVTGRAKLSA